MARRMNLEIRVSDLHIEQVDADGDSATGLGVEEGTRLTRVRRVIRADGRPAAYLIDTLPETILKPGDLPSEFRGSILDFLIERGDNLRTSRAAITATNAPADVAKPLEIQRDDVLLQFISQLYDAHGAVVDYSYSYFIPGYFRFHVNRRVGNTN
jgi:GntR family transcriptional regulator